MMHDPPFEPDELIKFYDKQYRDQGIRDAAALYKWILTLLKVKQNEFVLDISCGEGILGYFAEKQGVNLVGLDFSSSALEIARSKLSCQKLILADGETLPFEKETFNYVVNLGSLEHYLHPEKGLLEAARVLTKDGLACFLLPNSFYVIDIIRVLLTGYGPNHFQPLERFATRAEWQELIERYGFKVITTKKYNTRFPTSAADMFWYLKRPKRLLMVLTNWLIPLNLSYSFVFVCKRTGAKR
jgi:ubiquinone/menaquinone biosynthesis C-methylase UbiE